MGWWLDVKRPSELNGKVISHLVRDTNLLAHKHQFEIRPWSGIDMQLLYALRLLRNCAQSTVHTPVKYTHERTTSVWVSQCIHTPPNCSLGHSPFIGSLARSFIPHVKFLISNKRCGRITMIHQMLPHSECNGMCQCHGKCLIQGEHWWQRPSWHYMLCI